MDGFRILSAEGITRELAGIERHWDAQPDERERFRAWAWTVSAVAETYAGENLADCAALLKEETDALHRVLAERLHLFGDISNELVSRRCFLEYLEYELMGPEPMRLAA